MSHGPGGRMWSRGPLDARPEVPARPAGARRGLGPVLKRLSVLLVLATGWSLSASARAAECGADLPAAHRAVAWGTAGLAGVVVAFVPDPAPWAVGRHVGLQGVVCGQGRLLRVDADMPAHRHGMNYRPTLQQAEGGRFTAQGLMLHMPGRWRIRFEIEADGRRQWLDHALEVK